MNSYLARLRQHIGHRKIPLIFASGCVLNDERKLLWQKRKDFGIWGLPGGILEQDESLPECVVREVEEETGLIVTPRRITGVYSSPDFDVVYPNGDEVQQITVCFECAVKGGKQAIDATETLELAWLPILTPPPTFPWYLAMVNDLIQGGKRAGFESGSIGDRKRGRSLSYIKELITTAIPLILPVVCAVIKNNQGETLLMKTGHDREWTLPWWIADMGERIDQTLTSNVREKIGLCVIPMRLVGIYSHELDSKIFDALYPSDILCPEKKAGGALTNKIAATHNIPFRCVDFLFECTTIENDIKSDSANPDAIQFFPHTALPLVSPQTKTYLHAASINCEETLF